MGGSKYHNYRTNTQLSKTKDSALNMVISMLSAHVSDLAIGYADSRSQLTANTAMYEGSLYCIILILRHNI
ncbi:hypothetical protein, partial [Desulfosporosinus sp. I2]|uniref:hypothetical protein n=1 Tax=Desulfosporosinus sp. I2 TaxID=1617025 RepID=UPI001A9A68CE